MSAQPITCPTCSFKNASTAKRCSSCGAGFGEDAKAKRPRNQLGFSVVWCGIAIGVLGVLTAALVVGLPKVITALDFEGYHGMLVTIPVWFLGGTLVGLISPGRTFTEPVVAALLVGIPTVGFLWSTQTVRTLPFFMYVILSFVGVMFTLIGAYFGERIQMGPPTKSVER
jgi:hypothetical protein